MRVIITTTLKHDSLFLAKLGPLLRASPDIEVIVITDREGPELDRVRWLWPQGFLARFGRLGGRVVLIAREVLRPRTRLVMAYNVIPHGLFAMVFGRLRRVPVFLHLISGPGEVEFADHPTIADNRLISRSSHPERWQRLARWLVSQADAVFVPGTRTRELLVDLGFEPSRIQVLHSAVDVTRFQPISDPRDIDVLVSAQLRERKRPMFTLRVLALLAEARPGLRFCWLGDGPLEAEFESELDRLGLRERVLWTTTDDVEAYYRRARVFLLCSLNEGLSLACMEAMACGAVPVTSDVGDMSDVAVSDETGELLPPSASEQDFVSRILPILDDEGRRAACSDAARALIVDKHDFEAETASWRRVLSDLSGEQRR